MQEQNRKTAIDLTDLAIGIVVLGFVVSLGTTILITSRNSQVENLPTYLVRNETINSVDINGEQLSKIWVKSIDSVMNSTGQITLTSGNYTTSISDTGVGTVKSITNGVYNNTNWNVSYTVYNTSDPRYAINDKAALGLTEYGNWFKIIIIVGVAAVVLSLIFMAFGNRGQGTSSY